MQQIERYGVIALVFLLVTIVAVSFWGDNKSPGFWSRLTGRVKKDEVAKTETPPATAEQALITNAPLNPVPAPTQPAPVLGALPPAQAPLTTPAVLDAATQPGAQPVAFTPPPAIAPVIAPATTPVTPVGVREYTVQKGDSLASIARRTLGSEQRWTEIQTLNGGLQPKALKVGSKIQLPADSKVAVQAPKTASKPASTELAAKPSAKSTPKTATPAASAGKRYTIQKGDTLYSIAEKKLGGKSHVQEILSANPGLDARHLVVGRSIQIPGTAGASDAAPLVAEAIAPRSAGPRVR